jgi:DNA-binding SARP family transcriptional activator
VDDVRLVRQSGGYILEVDPARTDLHQFRLLAERARNGVDDQLRLLETALGLWRGEPFKDLDTPWFNDVRVHLERERLTAELDLVDLALASGKHAQLVPELSTRAEQHPANERIAGQLMLALSRCGVPPKHWTTTSACDGC